MKEHLNELKLRIRQVRSAGEGKDLNVMKLRDGIGTVKMELNLIIWRIQLEDKTELWQNDELKSFLQSITVTAKRIQKNLTQLLQRSPEWFAIEEEKERKNFQENVSAVINRWIHRQG